MKSKLAGAVIFLSVVMMPSLVLANDIGAAFKYLQAGEFQKALPIIQDLAQRGDAIAQSHLGLMYFNGDGVDKDFNKASYWYEKSATSGLIHQATVDAMFQLAVLFKGYGGHPKDMARMIHWLEQAGNAGDVEAMNQLGLLFYDGQGVTKDYAKAFEWFSKAAAKNHPESQSFMGDLYRFGRSVDKDYAEAVRWYEKSAARNYPHALYMLAVMNGAGLGVPANRAKANAWYEKAAAVGHPEAKKMMTSLRANQVSIDGMSDDPEYGYRAEKAIRTGGPGPGKQRAFLDQLRGPEGQAVSYQRTGVCGAYQNAAQPFGQAMIDCYTVRYEGQAQPATIYLDLYRTESLKVPQGFTLQK